MKFYTLALLASIAFAQEATEAEAAPAEEPAPEVVEETPAEEEVVEEEPVVLPLPDQTVATDIVYTFNVMNVNDSQITQLTADSDPPKPETVGVTGTITASTDANGEGSVSIDLQGYWGAKFQNTNSYKDIVCHMAIDFRQNVTDTVTETVDGEEVESTIQVVKAETALMTGSRTGNGEVAVTAQQWPSSGVSFTSGWDYDTSLSDFVGDDIQQLDVWTGLTGGFITNGGSGSGLYWQGFSMVGSRPFVGGEVTFENGGTTTVTASTWVTKKGKREFNRGSMGYTIDLAMPVVEEDEPVDTTDGDETDGTETGASALSAATAAAVAVLALAF